MKRYHVYILANRPDGTLYIGVTGDLIRRIWQHKKKILEGFTKKYGINKLVYFEEYGDIDLAIHREKRLKEWQRKWKISLIEKNNPTWRDLYDEIV